MESKPVDSNDLNRVVDSLKSHIDDKFVAFEKYDKEVHSNIRAVLKLHSTALYGNGDSGLIKQVDRMETSYKTVKKMLVGFFALVSTIGAYLGFK